MFHSLVVTGWVCLDLKMNVSEKHPGNSCRDLLVGNLNKRSSGGVELGKKAGNKTAEDSSIHFCKNYHLLLMRVRRAAEASLAHRSGIHPGPMTAEQKHQHIHTHTPFHIWVSTQANVYESNLWKDMRDHGEHKKTWENIKTPQKTEPLAFLLWSDCANFFTSPPYWWEKRQLKVE